MNQPDNCPKCNSSWDGGSILESFIQQRQNGAEFWKDKSDAQIEKEMKSSYSPPYRWRREIGVELPHGHPNHYDGISYWECPDCHTTFNRFTLKEEPLI